MQEYNVQNIKNVAIIGSAHAGKTSVGEALLFNNKITNRLGKVVDGASILDYESEEIQRKISISSALFNIKKDNLKINFIDTPGYPAFVSQVITAVNVCETSLVVIGTDSGIEVLTRKAWKLAEAEKQSKIIFVNKMDKENHNLESLIADAKQKLSAKIHPLCWPLGNGADFKGVIDIVQQKAFVEKNNELEEEPIPENLKDKIATLRNALVEAAAENNEDLLNKYLENGELTKKELIQGLKIGVAAGDIVPLCVGSADKNIGLNKLEEYIALLAPTPAEKAKVIKYTNEKQEEQTRKIEIDGDPLIQIFKITEDPKIGEFFFFKVYQGSLKNAQELTDTSSKNKERIGHLFSFTGKNREEVTVLNAGDIGATPKLKTALIGHTLYGGKKNLQINPFEFPEPILIQAVKTESEKDIEKLGEGLQTLKKTDPCFHNKHIAEFNELVVAGMSKLHIDLMLEKIKTKYKLNLELFWPQIPYRETIVGTAKAQGKYKKQSGGHGQYGDCWIEIKKQNSGGGYKFLNAISGGVIPSKYIPSVEKGIKEAMGKGVLGGYPVVDVEIKLYDGSYHSVDSSDLAFQMAGVLAFKKAVETANPVLLEPIMDVKVTIPEEFVGDISADFNQRRGKVVTMETLEAGYKMIEAYVPMAETAQYAIDLKSITKGEGSFTQTFVKYEIAPSMVSQKVKADKVKTK